MVAAPALTPRIHRAIAALFPPAARDRVAHVLTHECTPAKLHSTQLLAGELERIRLAVLRIAGGEDRGFDRALRLAQTDYRDLLMGAGFGSDLSAHLAWSDDLAPLDPSERGR